MDSSTLRERLERDRFYERRKGPGKMFWFSPDDIKNIAGQYHVNTALAQFIWYRTEHSVRTYELLGVKNDDRILEIGCGTCRFTAGTLMCNRNKRFTHVALDYSQVGVRKGMDNLHNWGLRGDCQLLVADAITLPFADNSFDIVLAPSVIEHISNQGKALFELVRVCRKGGRVIISSDNACGKLADIDSKTLEVWGVRILRRIGLLEKHRYPTVHTPWAIRKVLRNIGLELETFEFTHFHLPFWRALLTLAGRLSFLQQFLLNLFVAVEKVSRDSRFGFLHLAYIYIGTKRVISSDFEER